MAGRPAETQPNDIALLEELTEFIQRGQCAVFVGPDLSESANGFLGLPTSWQLADELATLCGYRGGFQPLAHIAQIFEARKDREQLLSYLVERLDAPHYRPLPIHTLLARIPFNVIVYGGWDVLLDQALRDQGRPFSLIRTNEDLFTLVPNAPQLLLIKPYGSIDRPDTLRITENDQADAFFRVDQVVARLRMIVGQNALLVIGYALAQDALFVRIYHDMHRVQAEYQWPSVAVQSVLRSDEADAWRSRAITAVVEDPALFLYRLAAAVAGLQQPDLERPDLTLLSDAPQLPSEELSAQAQILDTVMEQAGVGELVEQTNVPLLSAEQVRDIEAMRAAYERLAQSFVPQVGAAHVWLRQGNLEYARGNLANAEDYYVRALASDPHLAAAHHNLYYVYLAQARWALALEQYHQAVAVRPDLAIVPPRYTIEAILGGGGSGTVFRAADAERERLVAIKVLHRADAQSERRLALLGREALMLQRIPHPNIVPVLDFDNFHGNYFLVMEFIAGRSLQAELQQRTRPFAPPEMLAIMTQVCAAVIEVHGHNIIHRDIKPSNILLTGSDNHVWLIDFGLARPVTPGENTVLGAASGSLQYVAPEQAHGLPTDFRTDVYYLGSLCYELLTGRNPQQGTYRPASDVMSGLPGALDLVIERARERSPDDRYPDVQRFLADLRAVAVPAPIFRLARLLRWWVVLSLLALLGFGLPAVSATPVVRELGRYGAAAGLIIFTTVSIFKLGVMPLARRTRSIGVARYGLVLGSLVGLGNSVLWLRSFAFASVLPAPRLAYAAMTDYLFLVTSSLLLSLTGAMGTLGLLVLLSSVDPHRHRIGRRFFLVYAAVTTSVLIAALVLAAVQPPGWFGDLSPSGQPFQGNPAGTHR